MLFSFHLPSFPGLPSLSLSLSLPPSLPKVDWPSYSSRHRGVPPHSFIWGWKLISSERTSHNHIPSPPLPLLIRSRLIRPTSSFLLSFLYLPILFLSHKLQNHPVMVTVYYLESLSSFELPVVPLWCFHHTCFRQFEDDHMKEAIRRIHLYPSWSCFTPRWTFRLFSLIQI